MLTGFKPLYHSQLCAVNHRVQTSRGAIPLADQTTRCGNYDGPNVISRANNISFISTTIFFYLTSLWSGLKKKFYLSSIKDGCENKK